jgi:hypothetical protein
VSVIALLISFTGILLLAYKKASDFLCVDFVFGNFTEFVVLTGFWWSH